MRHRNATGAYTHHLGYIQDTDPELLGDPIPEGMAWIDTSTSPPYQLYVRNSSDDGWDEVGGAGSSSGTAGGDLSGTYPNPTVIADSHLHTIATIDDDELVALAAAATTGLVSRTAAGTYARRTLTAPAAGMTVTNGDGVSGNPTLVLANDLLGLESISGTGLAVRTATDTWTPRTITGSGSVSVTNGNGVSGNPVISVTSDSLPDIQVFDTPGTGPTVPANVYTKPSGATMVWVFVVGGGGGGGGGVRAAAGGNRFGGGGGGGGAVTTGWIPASALSSTVNVTVGSGGTHGAVAPTDSSSGGDGDSGTYSSFSTFRANGGSGGIGGQTGSTGGDAGAGGTTYAQFAGNAGGDGHASTAGANGGSTTNGAGGGGGGGGISSGNVSQDAGDGGRPILITTAGGSGGLASGTNGTAGSAPSSYWAGTGGGGGVNVTSFRTGKNGARGGGGGGGSASLNPTSSGAGGDGGDGYVVVISY